MAKLGSAITSKTALTDRLTDIVSLTEIIKSIENKFDVVLSDDMVAQAKTVGSLVAMVEIERDSLGGSGPRQIDY
ncbi:phosphopantetheine-binding protein [Pseudomonas sp. Marseille-Q5115]|uniref:phosphopantetheine-binding protein n=1 Tax=Pseudomonas sp. Marseille-Q5115 TaxID=2866593 RepID=UPI0039A40026